MKKRVLGSLLCALLVSVYVGCDAESTSSEPTEAASVATIEESTPESIVEGIVTTEETEAPTLEVTSEVMQEEETMEEISEEPTVEPVPEPQVVYTYTNMSATMYATQTVNVRNLPSTDGEKIGSLSTNQEVVVTGQCNETSWFMFDYNGETAFVSNKYLSSEKVEVAPPTQEATQVENVPRAGDYQEGVWHNMGDYSFYLGDWTWPSGCQGGGFHLNDGSARFCWLNYSDAQNSALNAFIRANQCNCGEVTHGGIKPLWDEATKSYYFP